MPHLGDLNMKFYQCINFGGVTNFYFLEESGSNYLQLCGKILKINSLHINDSYLTIGSRGGFTRFKCKEVIDETIIHELNKLMVFQ